MQRSSKEAWLTGEGDLREADVDDVPTAGQSVRVRALSAKYSAEVQGQMKLTSEGAESVAKIDIAEMERLQFQHGVIEPSFGPLEVEMIQEKFGPAFRKVIAKIDELSGVDKEAIEKTEARFPHGGDEPRPGVGAPVPAGAAAGNGGSDLPVPAG